ncbi:hypothetical protein PoB_004571900 [Plakobranchus ocellatus]|uniref:Secreted protein n=1 Tax=Plakobranchus ocellatus TaxID=259542 RepID=A0AAV4BLM3_9GAST|nr:hypothetical protein PoB_004571900 [Plakobranchus ocellatus]
MHIRKSCRLTYAVLRFGQLVCTFESVVKLPTPFGELDILYSHSEVFPTQQSRPESLTSYVHIRMSCQIAYPVLRVGHLVCTFGSVADSPIPC